MSIFPKLRTTCAPISCRYLKEFCIEGMMIPSKQCRRAMFLVAAIASSWGLWNPAAARAQVPMARLADQRQDGGGPVPMLDHGARGALDLQNAVPVPIVCELPKTLFSWNPRTGGEEEGGEESENAEVEPIATDRPDFTEASSTVGLRVIQLEMGYTLFEDDENGVRSQVHSYPETLLRWGMFAEWFEWRVAWSHSDATLEDISNSGGEDLYVGCKLWLTPQQRWLPEMALVPQMTIPTGVDEFTAGEVLPGLNWLYGWDLSDRWSLAGSTQFNRAVDGVTADAYTEWAQSGTLGFGFSERLRSYTEWFAFFPSGADSAPTEHYLNGGFTYLISNDVQWDIRAGLGLSSAAADSFVGTGLSVRRR